MPPSLPLTTVGWRGHLATLVAGAAAPLAFAPFNLWPLALASCLWLLHALHVSTVLYTVQRMAQLSALFVFAGLLVYSYGRQRQRRSGRGRTC